MAFRETCGKVVKIEAKRALAKHKYPGLTKEKMVVENYLTAYRETGKVSHF